MTRPYRNFLGARFGKWIVIGNRQVTKTPGGGHSATWRCRCDCGSERQVYLSSLVRGGSTCCRKCANGDRGATIAGAHGFVEGEPRITNTHWYRIVQGAESRGREMSISKEYALSLFIEQKGLCALSGLKIELPVRARGSGTASLDRRDNSLGYIAGNVQWTHWHVNRMKGVMDQDRFIEVCIAIASSVSSEN